MPQTSSTGTVESRSARTWLERRSQNAAILRTLLCDQVGNLSECLCQGDPDACRNTDPAADALTQFPRKSSTSLFAALAQVQERSAQCEDSAVHW